nr:MAG TPA: hypothetical protein [Myoviridae sp. ctQ2H14]
MVLHLSIKVCVIIVKNQDKKRVLFLVMSLFIFTFAVI